MSWELPLLLQRALSAALKPQFCFTEMKHNWAGKHAEEDAVLGSATEMVAQKTVMQRNVPDGSGWKITLAPCLPLINLLFLSSDSVLRFITGAGQVVSARKKNCHSFRGRGKKVGLNCFSSKVSWIAVYCNRMNAEMRGRSVHTFKESSSCCSTFVIEIS